VAGAIALKRFPAGTRLAPVAIDDIPSDWATVDYMVTIAEHPEKPGVPILVFTPAVATVGATLSPVTVEDGAGGFLLVFDSDGDVVYA